MVSTDNLAIVLQSSLSSGSAKPQPLVVAGEKKKALRKTCARGPVWTVLAGGDPEKLLSRWTLILPP